MKPVDSSAISQASPPSPDDQGEVLGVSDRIAAESGDASDRFDEADEICRRSTDPVVAPVVGDVNILPAHFHGADAVHLHLRVGSGLVSVERDRLVGGQHSGGRMEIHIRPEDIRFEPLNADAVLTGTVVNHVSEGDYVDSYVDVNLAAGGTQRIMVRSTGVDAPGLFPIGAVTALGLTPRTMTIYPEAQAPSNVLP